MQIIKSLALSVLAVAALIGFASCQAKGTATTSGVSASTSTTSSK